MAVAWGFSTLGCPKLGLLEALALAREFGMAAVEVRFLDGSDDINASLSRFLAVPGNVEKAGGAGVAISCVNASLGLSASTAAETAAFRETAILADRLGAKYLRVFDGGKFGEAMSPAGRKTAKKVYREWRRWRDDNGLAVRMALETHGATSETDRTLELFDLLGESLPVIWDTHHTMILGGEPYVRTWERLGPMVVEVHLKDSVDVPSARHPYTYVLPGRGRIPGAAIVAMLEGAGFGGYVILEWERRWHGYLPPLREALSALCDAGWRSGRQER